MAQLTKADILRAVKIIRLLDHAVDEAVGVDEAVAYSQKAELLAGRYRYGAAMRYYGHEVVGCISQYLR